jgi:hypothetical protein
MKTEDIEFGEIAGSYLIALQGDGGGGNSNGGTRKRDDKKAITWFCVVDLTDPTKTKVVSDRNLLGYRDPPADFIIKKYFNEFDPYIVAGGYCGSAGHFAMMGGPVPHGDKLLIQSSAFLYCIGGK